MRVKCYLSGGCKWPTIHAEWLAPDKVHPFTRLLEFQQCPWCNDTRAVLTSPEISDTRMTLPRRWLDNGVVQEVKP